MKQIIKKYANGNILYKYYTNHLGQFNGLFIDYYPNGDLLWKINYINDKKIGLEKCCNNNHNNNKPTNIIYNL